MTSYDRRGFHGAIARAPKAIFDEYTKVNALDICEGKTVRMNTLMKIWKLDKKWGHAAYNEIVTTTEKQSFQHKREGVPWELMVAQLRGKKRAKTALQKGSIYAVKNPEDPTQIMYAWNSFKITSGWEVTHSQASR